MEENDKRRNSLLVECILYHEAATYDCLRQLSTLGKPVIPDAPMSANLALWNTVHSGRFIAGEGDDVRMINSRLESMIVRHRLEVGPGDGIPPSCRELNCTLWSVLDRAPAL